ncbi:MAG: hypothetical protein R3A10_08225 [Caldilineaceae bacterium]
MSNLRADRIFFYLLLGVALLAAFFLIKPYVGAVVLAVTVAVVLQPMHRFYLRRTRGRKGPATVLTLATTVVVVVIPTLLGLYLLLESFQALAHDVAVAVQSPQERLLPPIQQLEAWIVNSGIADQLRIEEGEIQASAHTWITQLGSDSSDGSRRSASPHSISSCPSSSSSPCWGRCSPTAIAPWP